MRILSTFLLLTGAIPAFSQAPESLLGQLPSPLANVCNAGEEELRSFREKLSSVGKAIESQLAVSRKQEKDAAKQMEGRMKAQAMEAAGISPGTVDMNKKMSKEERRALAEQTIQAQTGMTMEEIQKLKAMTKEERRAYATAKSQAGELGPKTPRTQPPQPPQIPGSSLSMEEMKEQRRLIQENTARGARLQARYAQLEKDYSAATRGSEPTRDYSSMDRPPDPICQEFAKRYRAILADHLTETRQLIQDSKRLEELTAKQFGVPTAPGAGSSGLRAVQEYAGKLGSLLGLFRR